MIPLFDWEKHRVIMESSFHFDGYDFLFFEEGVPFFSLFRTSRKLNSHYEIRYAGEVLLYLNPTLEYEKFKEMMLELTDRSNGHVVRTYSEERVLDMVNIVFDRFNPSKMPYVRRYRKIIFNPAKPWTTEEKRAIIGKTIGSSSKINEEVIYDAVEKLMMDEVIITTTIIAEELKCSRQTVSSKITKPIKDIIKSHNSYVRLNEVDEEIMYKVNSLTEGKEVKIEVLKYLVNSSKPQVRKIIDTFFGN